MGNIEYENGGERAATSGSSLSDHVDIVALMKTQDRTRINDQTKGNLESLSFNDHQAFSPKLGFNLNPTAHQIHIDQTAFLTPKVGQTSLSSRLDGLKT